jgi:microcystin-dependent protein
MTLDNLIVSRDKASRHLRSPNAIYQGNITSVRDDGRVHVRIHSLGLSLGPIMPINTTPLNVLSKGDTVVCTFTDETNTNLVILGSATKKDDIYAPADNGISIYENYGARNSALPSPSEGRVIYLLNTDELQIYNGTEWITVIDTGNSENIAASTLTVGTLTATGLSTLSASTAIGDVSATEINYLNGVTSNIQTQMDLKAPLASPALTGVPIAPTASAGTNTTQLATTAFVDAAVSVGMPTGAIIPFAGSTAPTGWLLCDGGSTGLLRTTYAALFAVIGTTYGSGDGSTTFNVPDLRGRVVAGKDNMGGVAANRLSASVSGVTGTTLGAVGGSQSLTSHNHTQNSHNHTQDSHNHTQDSHNHTQNGHAHSNSLNGTTTFAADGHTHAGQGTLHAAVGATNASTNRIGHIAGGVYANPSTYSLQGTSALTSQDFNHNTPVYGSTGGNNVSATVGINNTSTETATNIATIATNIATTATNQVTTATNNSTGAGSSENVQPTIILNYIIKA